MFVSEGASADLEALWTVETTVDLMRTTQRRFGRNGALRIGSMGVLLALLMLDVFVISFSITPQALASRTERDVFLTLVLISGTAAVAQMRTYRYAVASIAAIAILLRWTAWFLPLSFTSSMLGASTIFALCTLSGVLAVNVFSSGEVTLDRILGAVALYVLIAAVWAEAYELISLYVPAAFAGADGVEEMKDRSTWVYFSFVTLTTVGYGDITPLAHAARALAIMEALIGQLYPAIVLARLISLSVSKSDPTAGQS